MPQHDPVPPKAPPHVGEAWASYKRFMRWMVLVALACAALAVVWLTSDGTPLTIHMVVATVAGVSLSILVGTGLMGLVFLSNRTGHDEAAQGDLHDNR